MNTVASFAFNRVWAMPSPDTFSVLPIGDMVKRYLANSSISCDPFARNKRWATYTNDINPNTSAQFHMNAVAFLQMLYSNGHRCDLAIVDPPYSPRQISECYNEAGLHCGTVETQNATLYRNVKDAVNDILTPDGIVLSFGWNSSGMGIKRRFEIVEILMVCHGGAHNDTICMAERRMKGSIALHKQPLLALEGV